MFLCVCMASGGRTVQMQRHSKVDKLLCLKLGEEKGCCQVEELPHVPGLFLLVSSLFLNPAWAVVGDSSEVGSLTCRTHAAP